MCTTKIEAGAQSFPQCTPEMAHKFHVLVRSQRLRYAMQTNNLGEIETSDLTRIICLGTRDKMAHFRETVHDNHNRILLSLGPRETYHKIKTHVLSRTIRHRQRRIQPRIRPMCFGNVTRTTPINYFCNRHTHFRLKKTFFNQLQRFIAAKVAR